MNIIHRLGIIVICYFFLSSSLKAEEIESNSKSLKEIMQGLSLETQSIAAGIFNEDFKLIQKAARQIAEHPKAPLESRVKLAKYFGAEMAQFKAFDQNVHNSAVAISDDAAELDMPAVLSNYHRLIEGCQSCHTTFKSRAVDILSK